VIRLQTSTTVRDDSGGAGCGAASPRPTAVSGR